MNASDIAVIISAGASAASVVLGIGQLTAKLTDVRDDMRALRQDLQSCLQTMLLMIKPGNPGEPPRKE